MNPFQEMLAGRAHLVYHRPNPKIGDAIEIYLHHAYRLQTDEEVCHFRAYLESLGFTVEGGNEA